MTLLEVMVAVTILTIVMGALFSLSIGLGDTAGVQQVKAASSDETRRAMLTLTRELRQAGNASITGMPGASITYRVATDLDGNGTAVDASGFLELSAVRTIQRDTTDLNHDGQTTSQLILKEGDTVQVLANNLLDDEDANQNKVLDAGEDTNGNGQLDHGVWFQRSGNTVQVSIQTHGETRRGYDLMSSMAESLQPRN